MPLIEASVMSCPKCGASTRCMDSRPGPGDTNTIRRRRRCVADACGERFTTYEMIVARPATIDVCMLSRSVQVHLDAMAAELERLRSLIGAAAHLGELEQKRFSGPAQTRDPS